MLELIFEVGALLYQVVDAVVLVQSWNLLK